MLALLVFMTMALAVAMVACQGAVGQTGETGKPGPAGPPGQPSEPENLAPIARATDALTAPSLVEEGPDRMMVVSGYFVDPNGDALKYGHTVEPSTGVVRVALAANEDGDYELTFSPVAAGMATVIVTAMDPDGLSASITINVVVDEEGMQGPEYVGDLPSSIALMPGQQETIDVEGAFVEHEGEPLTIGFKVSDEDPAHVQVSQDGNEITITALATPGNAVVTIIATDTDGEMEEYEITVSVRATLKPTVNDMIPDPVMLDLGGSSKTVDASMYFTDPMVGGLVYKAAVKGDAATASADSSTGMVTITPVAVGMATITVTASNDHGSDMQTISVTVNGTPPMDTGKIDPITLMIGQSKSVGLAPYFTEGAGGGPITSYTPNVDKPAVVSATVLGNTTLLIEAVTAGSAIITVTATDADGEIAMQTIMVTVEAEEAPEQNMAPSIKKAIGDRKVEMIASGDNAGMEISIELSEHFEDPEKGPLYYSVSIVSQSPTDTETTPAPKVIDLVAGYPNGTNLDSLLKIDAMNTGSAMVKVVARDAQLAATESMFMVTVVTADSNEAPDNIAPGTAPVGAITDVATSRLKVGDTKNVIDNREIIEYFTDLDFPTVTLGQPGDTLTFSIKYYPASVADGDALFNAAGDPVTPVPEALAEGKNQVSADILPTTTWTGNLKSRFTLSVTALRGTSAAATESDRNDHVAIIATDEFGKSAARVFPVRVNYPPQAYSSHPMEKDRKTLADVDSVRNMTVSETATEVRLINSAADQHDGYFSDMDGDDLLCRFTVSDTSENPVATIGWVSASERQVLSVTPNKRGTMSVDVWCFDQLGSPATDFESSEKATLNISVSFDGSIH